MSGEAGGWMWLLIDVGLVLILASALAYGAMAWRKRRNPAVDDIRDRATENLYRRRDPESRKPRLNQGPK